MKPTSSLARLILLVLAGSLFAACVAPVSSSHTPAPSILVTATATVTPSPVPPTEEPCGYQWATRSLSAESEKLQSALAAAGLEGIAARAEAFGENCVTASGKVLSFSTMQTDFHLGAEMADLSDEQALGQVIEAALAVLASFPAGSFPGPNRGYLGIAFHQGDETRNLWVRLDDAQRALDEGLRGADLFRRLSGAE